MEREGRADWSNIVLVSGWVCPACEEGGLRPAGGQRALMVGASVARLARASQKFFPCTSTFVRLFTPTHNTQKLHAPAARACSLSSMASSRIFVRNLPPTLSEADFRKHFAQRDAVTDAKLLGHRRIGYVGFKTPEAAEKAVKYFNKTFIRMSRIGVELARPVRPASRLRARFC